MKSVKSIILALLFVLPLLSGCNDASFTTDPACESEGVLQTFSLIESEVFEESLSPSPTSALVYPELPFAVDEICWGGAAVNEGTSIAYIGTVPFMDFGGGVHYSQDAREDQPVAFFLSLNFIYARTYHENIPVMLAQLENAGEHPEGITHQWLVNEVFDENGVYDTEKGAEWIRDLRYCAPVYENIMQIGEEASTAQMKADWKTRCASKGITCVDTGSDGLWIFCTRDQLASMVLKEEARFTLYRLSVPTQYLYSKEREHIVNS